MSPVMQASTLAVPGTPHCNEGFHCALCDPASSPSAHPRWASPTTSEPSVSSRAPDISQVSCLDPPLLPLSWQCSLTHSLGASHPRSGPSRGDLATFRDTQPLTAPPCLLAYHSAAPVPFLPCYQGASGPLYMLLLCLECPSQDITVFMFLLRQAFSSHFI